MKIISASYIKSIPRVDMRNTMRPLPEIAFLGRSNVGKSSLINFLCDRKSLAKTSAKPGKTIYFNYFLINESHYWVDMPGYGFAHVSKAMRSQWSAELKAFTATNPYLVQLFLLIDGRIPMQKIDIKMMEQLTIYRVPWSVIFTKSEKVKNIKKQQLVQSVQTEVSTFRKRTPFRYFMSSALGRLGKEDILGYIEEIVSTP